jgi:hypothetical protein
MDKRIILEAVLGEIKTPIFLADLDKQQSKLTLHVSEGADVASLQGAAKRASAKIAGPIQVSVRTHRLHKLAHPRSIEHWLRQFATGEIIYDPTMVMLRARGLLAAAQACRSTLGDAIRGSFFDPTHRTLFVLERRKAADATLTLAPRVRTTIEQAWDDAMDQIGHNARDRYWTSIQVVADLPHRELVAVDAKSASAVRSMRRTVRRWFAPLALAFALAGVAVPASADVNVVRGQFGILGGLSVFGDNTVPQKLDLFAFAGLHQYFGDAKGIRVAQLYRCPDGSFVADRRNCQPELGNTGNGSTSSGFGFGVGTGGTAGGTSGS